MADGPLSPVLLRPRVASAARGLQNLAFLRHPRGPLPHAIVIGAQKGGTTALAAALARHPALAPARRKEAHFADWNWHRGEGWYRRLFRDRPGERGFEATPNYLFFPHAAARLARVVPGARLIALLRDPVERAVSHHRYERQRGGETLSFAEAIAAEAKRTDGDWARALDDPGAWTTALQRHSYLRRGLYGEQLERWHAHFPADQILVLDSAELFARPEEVLCRVLDFLGVPRRPDLRLAPCNVSRPDGSRPAEVPASLYAHFAEDARLLARRHGTGFRWLARCGLGRG